MHGKVFVADEYSRDLRDAFAKIEETISNAQQKHKVAVDKHRRLVHISIDDWFFSNFQKLVCIIQREKDDVDPDAMSYEELMGLTEALGAQNKGLTPKEIRMLSVKKYKRCCFRSSKEEQCVICQQQYQRGDSIIFLPSCKHTYHKKCIRKWLEIKKMCPICNVEVEVH
ncbi:hypothetical protein L7F22_017095 [Adiantum nelumboides]|nr:hypothetical protein [Adiantum nelumboides]